MVGIRLVRPLNMLHQELAACKGGLKPFNPFVQNNMVFNVASMLAKLIFMFLFSGRNVQLGVFLARRV